MKTVFILRGTPSSGKTTAAEAMVGRENVVCADDYFYEIGNGTYAFDFRLLADAHKQCKGKFAAMVNEGREKIAVANTNSKESEFEFYKEVAESAGYMVVVMVIEKRHNQKNTHNVPEETIGRMATNILMSIKLS